MPVRPRSRPPRRRALSPPPVDPVSALARLFEALAEGFLARLARRDPQEAARARAWLDECLAQYERLALLQGPAAAVEWLSAALRTPAFPDLRRVRTLKADRQLIAKAAHLRRRLAPIFRAHPNARERNRLAAPIIAEVLGSPIRPDALPLVPHPAQFCDELLGVSPERMSRARRRWKARVLGPLLAEVDSLFGVLVASLPPRDPRRPTVARLRREFRRLVAPYRPTPRSR